MRATAIRPYIARRAAWILQKLDLARRHAPVYPAHLHAGASIRLFGRQYQLRVFATEINGIIFSVQEALP